jgi:hypothetical protein
MLETYVIKWHRKFIDEINIGKTAVAEIVDKNKQNNRTSGDVTEIGGETKDRYEANRIIERILSRNT